MIAALIFIVAFLLLGLGVVLAAFGGGPGRRRGTRRAPSRTGRRLIAVSVAVVIVGLGVAVPLAVGLVNGDNHAKNAPGGVELSASAERGRSLFAKAVGKVGPNLDSLRPPKALVLDAIAKGRARGNGQMPAGLLQGQDATDVANFVAAVAGRD
jgi:hypothetical protein